MSRATSETLFDRRGAVGAIQRQKKRESRNHSTAAVSNAVHRERPLLVCGQLIPKIADGTKTQTRRLVKPQPTNRILRGDDGNWYDADCINPGVRVKCPYEVGMTLWVRETWAPCIGGPCEPGNPVLYRADNLDGYDRLTWRSPIHMPRWASRYTLELTGVRVEKLTSITAADAWAEGVRPPGVAEYAGDGTEDAVEPTSATLDAFRDLWDRLNGSKPGCAWKDNPWVFALSFKRIDDA